MKKVVENVSFEINIRLHENNTLIIHVGVSNVRDANIIL